MFSLSILACSGKENSTTSLNEVDNDNEIDSSNVVVTDNGTNDEEDDDIYPMPDEYYVEWAIPDAANIPDENIIAFNDMLSDNGYDFGVKFINLDFDDYSEALKEYSPDIAFIGFDDIAKDKTTSVIASGYFENLDSYLENSTIYSKMSSKLWDSVRYNGSIFTIPNCSAQDAPVSIAFNLDKVSKDVAESFDGNISEIKDILEDGILLYQVVGFEFASYYGYEYKSGVLVSEDGDVLNFFDSEECVDWLRTINELYVNNQVTDDTAKDWTICITKDVGALDSENTYVYAKKAIIGTRYSASTGILSASDKKDDAFKLLELLHTDSDYANCLIYGTEFLEKDGYAVNTAGEVIDSYLYKLILGLNESLLWTTDNLLKFESYEDKIDYYDKSVVESPAMDVQLENDTSELFEIMQNQIYLWQSDNLESDINNLKTSLQASNIEAVISEMSDKISAKQQ
jgi:ABC-type glycerol-3-phosphate transport system substrate-binding protein